MSYEMLAGELLDEMRTLHKVKMQKHINEAFRGEAFILDYIAEHEGVLPSQIGHEMEVSSARIASALNNLEKKGMITRQIDRHDRRKILIELTGEGREAADRHRQAMLRYITQMLRMLGEDDAREYIRIQKRLAEILPCCAELG